MLLLASRSKLKFLRDENVKKRLENFLISKGFDVINSSKRSSDEKLASISKSDKRVLVTNDTHFSDSFLFPKEKIFSVVLLRIPQDKPDALLKSFSKLLKSKSKPEDFEGFLITLKEDKFEVSPIISLKELVK
ncbi:DUF5615 family PIN-like protein [Candidatus Woesearchaeota archaeon]|nr:DUF5615 family PIN-like protein [Candidatus Woesearchaeota archaeon]